MTPAEEFDYECMLAWEAYDKIKPYIAANDPSDYCQFCKKPIPSCDCEGRGGYKPLCYHSA